MSNKKYGEIDWVGEIPAHWDVKRIKDILNLKGGGVDKKVNEGEKLVKLVNFVDVFKKISLNNNQNYMVVSCPENKIKDVSLKKNDILITPSSETPKEIGLANIVLEDLNNTVFSYHILRLRSIIKSLNPKYAYYYFNSKLAAFQFEEKAIGTTRVTLSRHDINSNIVFYPSEKEQTQIANYLDTETSKIDRKISILEQKFERLEEYKQSVIFETVTKGLDSNIEMKDSGIDWIGDIPKHWKVKRIKDLFKIGRGRVIATTEVEKEKTEENQYPVYSAATENNGIIGYINTFDFDQSLLTWTTDGAKAGTVFIREGEFNCTNVCGTLIAKNKQKNLKFYKYALEVQTPYYKRADINGAKIMNNEMAAILIVESSSNQEQNNIVEYLDQFTSNIDKKKEIIKKQIRLLKEYKQTIIYEAVTGKMEIL